MKCHRKRKIFSIKYIVVSENVSTITGCSENEDIVLNNKDSIDYLRKFGSVFEENL